MNSIACFRQYYSIFSLILFSFMKQLPTMKRSYYNEFFEKEQLKFYFDLFQIGLPSDDPVYTLKKVLEELNYTSLIAQYSTKGRKGYNPIMIHAVMTYAAMRGVKSVDRIVELCERDIAFIRLTKGQKPQRDVFYDFNKWKLTGEILDDLHYQFLRRLQKEGLITLESLFVDGTKIEANANRYTFVWRGSINYHLAGLLDTIDALYTKYNTLIEIDHCSPLELLQLQTNLIKIAKGEGITFTIGKGKRKPELQQLHEEIEACGERLLKYKECYEVMGTDWNSYSKTDVAATFMRMKEDHMKNEQLKPAYNVQIAVENYFIIHTYISNDLTDYNTLIPVLEKHRNAFGRYPKEATADSGYCSEKNLLYLKANKITSYIKLQTHEKMKTRAYQENIGKHYNMMYMIDEDSSYYRCHDGRNLTHLRTETSQQDGYRRILEVYGCEDCSGCEHKARCLYKYDNERDAKKNKVMKINEVWEDLKSESHENIQSEKGILNRQIRSIQTEGHFGDIKENDGFRHFHYRSEEMVYKEFQLYAMGRNINKYHRFLTGKLKEYQGKAEQETA